MSYGPKTMCITLEATLGRRNSLSPTGSRLYPHLNLIGFCQIFPIGIFSPNYFFVKIHFFLLSKHEEKCIKISPKEQIFKLNFFLDEICST